MSSPPRLLPLIAVAIGGVLAVKALSGVQALPDLFAATRARAEEAPAAAAHKPHATSPLPSQTSATAPGPKPPAACIETPADLAKDAGVSPGELQVLQNLGARRGQLDDRERALDTQLQLLAAAEAKVDAKLKAVTAVKAQIQGLIGQADQQQQADVDRLTLVYQKMKPRDAAAVMATLDDKVRIPVAAKMKDTALAAILSQMPTVEAKKLTESLAQRADNAKQALNAAVNATTTPVVAAAQSSDPLLAATPEPKAKRVKSKRLARARRTTPTAAAAAELAPVKPTPVAPVPAPAKAATALPTKPAPVTAAKS